jgi:hypothetical protein
MWRQMFMRCELHEPSADMTGAVKRKAKISDQKQMFMRCKLHEDHLPTCSAVAADQRGRQVVADVHELNSMNHLMTYTTR